MRFCGSCGCPLEPQCTPSAGAPQADVPSATAVLPPVPLPTPLNLQSGSATVPAAQDTGAKKGKKSIVIVVIAIIAVVVLVAGLAIWQIDDRGDDASSARNGSATAQNADKQPKKTKKSEAAKQEQGLLDNARRGLGKR